MCLIKTWMAKIKTEDMVNFVFSCCHFTSTFLFGHSLDQVMVIVSAFLTGIITVSGTRRFVARLRICDADRYRHGKDGLCNKETEGRIVVVCFSSSRI